MKDYKIATNRIDLCKQLAKFMEKNSLSRKAVGRITGVNSASISTYIRLTALPNINTCATLDTFMREWHPEPTPEQDTIEADKADFSETKEAITKVIKFSEKIEDTSERLVIVCNRLESMLNRYDKDRDVDEAQRQMPWLKNK